MDFARWLLPILCVILTAILGAIGALLSRTIRRVDAQSASRDAKLEKVVLDVHDLLLKVEQHDTRIDKIDVAIDKLADIASGVRLTLKNHLEWTEREYPYFREKLDRPYQDRAG